MADDSPVEVPEGEGPDMKQKAVDHFDKKNKNALAAGVAGATTDTSLITQWLAQTIFSAINLGSHVSAMSQRCIPTDFGCESYEWTRADKWTTTVESISLALALLVTLGHWCCMKYATKYILGKMPEGIVAFIVLAFVAAGMPAIMSPDNDQAIAEDGSILNANLYFFSWAGLAVAVYVFCTWLFHHCFKKRNLSAGVPKNKWYLLLAASVIVTSSASRLFTSSCKDSGFGTDASESFCNRTKFAIAAGALGTFGALVASVLSFTNHLGVYPEAATSFILFVLFVLGIAFLTFGGDDAPAGNVGNLYFSVWICFILAMFLSSMSFNAIKKKRKGGDEEEVENQDEETPAEDKAEEMVPEQPAEAAAGDSAKKSGAEVAASF